jgi:hypothetical protein
MIIELTCPYCHFSKGVPKEKIPLSANAAICPRCGRQFLLHAHEPGIGSPLGEKGADSEFAENGDFFEKDRQRTETPWENRSESGYLQAGFKTFKQVLFHPKALFENLAFRGRIAEPLAFGLLAGSIGSMFGFLWQFLTVSGGLSLFGVSIYDQLAPWSVFLLMIVIVPAFVTLGMFIYSFILHLFLIIVRGAKNGFQATFRVVCYSQAAQLWALVPIIGGWIGWIWELTIQIVGLREIHQTSYFRVITSFLLPAVMILLLILAASILALFTFIPREYFG